MMSEECDSVSYNVWVFPCGCRKFITKMAFTVGFSSAIVTWNHTHRFEQISVSSVLVSQASPLSSDCLLEN